MQHNSSEAVISRRESRSNGESRASRRTAHLRAMPVATSQRAENRNYPPQTYNGVKLHDLLSQKEPSMDLYAWQLRARAQPLYKAVQTARKAVTSDNWKVSLDYFQKKKRDSWTLSSITAASVGRATICEAVATNRGTEGQKLVELQAAQTVQGAN